AELVAAHNPRHGTGAVLKRLMHAVLGGRLRAHLAQPPEDGYWTTGDVAIDEGTGRATGRRVLLLSEPKHLLRPLLACLSERDRHAAERLAELPDARALPLLAERDPDSYDPDRTYLRRLHLSAADAAAWCRRERWIVPALWAREMTAAPAGIGWADP